MARVKKQLEVMFSSCKTNADIFKMIANARNAGFEIDEINTMASIQKNRLAKQNDQNYKKIPVTEHNIRPKNMFISLPFTERHMNSNVIEFTPQGFII